MFFAGLVIGIGTMCVIVQQGPTQVIAQQSHAIAVESVIYATLLHDQKYADLNGLLEVNMIASLKGMKAMGFTDQYQSSASLVRGYYDLPGTEMPGQLASSLASIKGSDVRRLASAMSDPKIVRKIRDAQ